MLCKHEVLILLHVEMIYSSALQLLLPLEQDLGQVHSQSSVSLGVGSVLLGSAWKSVSS